MLLIQLCLTELRGRVVNIPASYSGRPEFICGPGGRISPLRFLIVFLSISKIMPGEYLKIKSRPLPSKSFPVHHSCVTLSFDTVYKTIYVVLVTGKTS
jgi:hypothetical protein